MAGQMTELSATPLGQAIQFGTTQEVRKLIKYGHDPLFKDTKGNTYLHFVCTMHRPYIFHILAASGIDINAQNKHGNTALHVTALHDDCSHVTDLMRAGIDPFIQNMDGKTAAEITTTNKYWHDVYSKYLPGLFKAIDDHDLEMTDHLFRCWCNVDVMRNGKTARQYAAARAFHDIVSIIDRLKHSIRAVYGVLENDYEKATQALARPECDPNFIKQDGIQNHVLQHAIRQEQHSMVKALLKAGADVNTLVQLKDYYRAPLYFEALKQNDFANKQITLDVISSGADFCQKDERGRTALMYCIDHSDDVSMDVINYLLANGANIADRDETGLTSRNIAQLARKQDIVDAIDKHLIRLIRASDVGALWGLAVHGYDDFFIDFNYRDSWIYAAGNETDHVTRFLHMLRPFQEEVDKIHQAAMTGAVETVRQTLRNSHHPDLLIRAKDKGGRTPLLKAVLYCQEEVVKAILSSYPNSASTDRDNCNRTAMHYACALGVDGSILQNIIQEYLTSETAVDVAGRTPQDMEEAAEVEDSEDFASIERKKRYGMDLELHCIEKYEQLLAIIKSKRKGLKHFLEILKDVRYPVSSFRELFQPHGHLLVSHFEDMLFTAVDHGKKDIARRLVMIGVDCKRKQTYDLGGSRLSMDVEERARTLGMTDLALYIKCRRQGAES